MATALVQLTLGVALVTRPAPLQPTLARRAHSSAHPLPRWSRRRRLRAFAAALAALASCSSCCQSTGRRCRGCRRRNCCARSSAGSAPPARGCAATRSSASACSPPPGAACYRRVAGAARAAVDGRRVNAPAAADRDVRDARRRFLLSPYVSDAVQHLLYLCVWLGAPLSKPSLHALQVLLSHLLWIAVAERADARHPPRPLLPAAVFSRRGARR